MLIDCCFQERSAGCDIGPRRLYCLLSLVEVCGAIELEWWMVSLGAEKEPITGLPQLWKCRLDLNLLCFSLLVSLGNRITNWNTTLQSVNLSFIFPLFLLPSLLSLFSKFKSQTQLFSCSFWVKIRRFLRGSYLELERYNRKTFWFSIFQMESTNEM